MALVFFLNCELLVKRVKEGHELFLLLCKKHVLLSNFKDWNYVFLLNNQMGSYFQC